MGRPTKYDPELTSQICDAIAVTPKSLEVICAAREDFPHHETVRRWLHISDDFRGMYARAKAVQCLTLAEQIIDISDDSSNDEIEIRTEDGLTETRVNREVIERARIRIDSRKWLCAKLAPRIFGDKITHQGDSENPVVHEIRGMKAVREALYGTKGE